MKNFKVSLFILCIFLNSSSLSSASSQSLTRGESTTIHTEYEIGDVAVTDPKVIDFLVHEGRRSIYLNAKKEGFATLTLWDIEGDVRETIPITVYHAALRDILAAAKETFRSIATIQFLIRDNSLHIVGEAPSPSDFKRIEAFANRHSQVVSEVMMAKPVLNTLTAHIQNAIATPGIKVRSVRNHIVLEGIAYSESAMIQSKQGSTFFRKSRHCFGFQLANSLFSFSNCKTDIP